LHGERARDAFQKIDASLRAFSPIHFITKLFIKKIFIKIKKVTGLMARTKASTFSLFLHGERAPLFSGSYGKP
jgi:hypothetical protein